ncbi:amidohydrolase family protein [Antarctobacter sp.]|uniref:amidohydrolase family protein n=1 Tax=Antarctobacter sp. TaxID=1872577 RepID=UPI003A8E6016
MKSKRLEGREETILEPDLPIVDSHIHLFDLPNNRYMLDDYMADATGGHNIVASIYCETQVYSRTDGPEHLRPLGEVEFANGIAAMAATGQYGPCKVNHGIIGHANLSLGAQVGALLDRCMAAAPDRYRGVRHVAVEHPDDRPYKFIMTFKPPRGVLDTPGFPAGLAELEKRGLTFDAAVWDPTLPRLIALADQFPNLTFILNHMGTAVGVDMSPDEKAEIFARWRDNIRALAERPNVVCKTGGLGMPFWGFGFEAREDVVVSEELAKVWRPYFETAVEAFGPARCMMESNFPPDGRSSGYVPLWNAYKILTRGASAEEKAALYSGTAARIYRLEI